MPRKKLNKIQSHWRINPETKDTLSNIAMVLGYKYHEEGAVGEMLDAIANGDILLIPKRK